MSRTESLLFASIEWSLPGSWRWLAALVLMALSLVLSLPSGVPHGVRRRAVALLSGFVGLALLWWSVPRWGTMTSEAGFLVFAIITVASAGATIASRSPVYSAIWFAVSLLGMAGLLLLQGAQFLGIATVAVYAGAIVVTFLFVLMLAQPEGHAYYDRVGWGLTPRCVTALTTVLFVLLIAASATRPNQQVLDDHAALLAALQVDVGGIVPGAQTRAIRYETRAEQRTARLTVAVPADQLEAFAQQAEVLQRVGLPHVQAQHPDWQVTRLVFDLQDVRTSDHTAHLGSQLFSRQLAAVQAVGALLLAALVGAVAIVGRTGGLDQEPGRA